MNTKLLFILNNLKNKTESEAGFSLIEALVAIVILGLAFAFNLQFLATLQINNIRQKIETVAVSASKEIMDDVRYNLQNDFTNSSYIIGQNPPIPIRRANQPGSSGYDLDADVYVCLDQPTINNDLSVDCPTTGNNTINYVVVQIIYEPSDEEVYTVQSAFSRLQ